jgi:hypothetical protein
MLKVGEVTRTERYGTLVMMKNSLGRRKLHTQD